MLGLFGELFQRCTEWPFLFSFSSPKKAVNTLFNFFYRNNKIQPFGVICKRNTNSDCIFWIMNIGTNIRELRKSKGWTQIELAQKLNVTQQAITAYERGKKRPPINKLPDIASLFDVSIEELIGKKPLKIETREHHLHKNKRTAKIQELFDKLPPLEQRAILKQVTALLEQHKK